MLQQLALRPLVNGANFFSLEAFLAFDNGEFNFLTVAQRTVTVALNGAEVYEYIFTGLTLNKTKTFSVVKPLDSALFTIGHNTILLM